MFNQLPEAPIYNAADAFTANFISEVYDCADVVVREDCSYTHIQNIQTIACLVLLQQPLFADDCHITRIRLPKFAPHNPHCPPPPHIHLVGRHGAAERRARGRCEQVQLDTMTSTTCSWVQPVDPTKNLLRAPCTGVMTLQTDWHKTTAQSTAAFSFWADTSKILTGQISSPIGPAVTATTGAWPKPDTVTDLNWAIVSGCICAMHTPTTSCAT